MDIQQSDEQTSSSVPRTQGLSTCRLHQHINYRVAGVIIQYLNAGKQ